jgi:hypothetical protein
VSRSCSSAGKVCKTDAGLISARYCACDHVCQQQRPTLSRTGQAQALFQGSASCSRKYTGHAVHPLRTHDVWVYSRCCGVFAQRIPPLPRVSTDIDRCVRVALCGKLLVRRACRHMTCAFYKEHASGVWANTMYLGR